MEGQEEKGCEQEGILKQSESYKHTRAMDIKKTDTLHFYILRHLISELGNGNIEKKKGQCQQGN